MMRATWWGLACVVGGLVLADPAAATNRAAERVTPGTVTYVTDGDTVWVQVDPAPGQARRKPVKLRLQGIDAPERCQAGGPQATEALKSRVLRQQVLMQTRGHDDHGRALGNLTLQGEDVSAWMVSEGHAWSYRYRRSLGPYAAQEQQARQARKGLFANDDALEPRQFRQQHGPCP